LLGDMVFQFMAFYKDKLEEFTEMLIEVIRL
jgi:hypothetical protein